MNRLVTSSFSFSRRISRSMPAASERRLSSRFSVRAGKVMSSTWLKEDMGSNGFGPYASSMDGSQQAQIARWPIDA